MILFIFDLIYSIRCFVSFFFISLLFSSLRTFFNLVSSNIDKSLSVNPSANVFVFGDFNFHHKDWLNYSSKTGRSGELCYNSSTSQERKFLNCLLKSLILMLKALLFWIDF